MPDADPFSIDRWAVEPTREPAAPATGPKRKQPARPKRAVRFLKGPIPWPWLRRAMHLRGKALAVGLMLWLRSGLGNTTTVHLCLARVAEEGIPMNTARRALQELEKAALVRVCRRPGRGLEVTILDAGQE